LSNGQAGLAHFISPTIFIFGKNKNYLVEQSSRDFVP